MGGGGRMKVNSVLFPLISRCDVYEELKAEYLGMKIGKPKDKNRKKKNKMAKLSRKRNRK